MTEQEKTIAKIFDKSVEALGIMTKTLCDAIKSTKTEKRYVMYQDQKCELLGTTEGGGTLNTGGLAFCIILPDGKVKNVQDTDCTFLSLAITFCVYKKWRIKTPKLSANAEHN